MAGCRAREGPPHRDEQTTGGGASTPSGKPDDERPPEREGKQQNQRSEWHAVLSGLSQSRDERKEMMHRMEGEFLHGRLSVGHL
jgi:hypothetical protein